MNDECTCAKHQAPTGIESLKEYKRSGYFAYFLFWLILALIPVELWFLPDAFAFISENAQRNFEMAGNPFLGWVKVAATWAFGLFIIGLANFIGFVMLSFAALFSIPAWVEEVETAYS
ncbi:hypothetical protein [Pseudomonas amygdali]|uniref:Uncharacterized protein n=1 Tax=Pseudomonas amygdali pv. lachrymans str. M301315 TaxID=629260 RepID=A0AAD0PWB7_PSEAV|nr:hypothetical protein [Pseudomonas amygdali]AXH59965.1 hypothetical protein PLA107_032585 [Pseudomonas amygdali pv. lachrymans str. M301315]RMT06334.1 hypothetical protein ALP54_03826 [Pseudomonas amygdali pv. lachrymans]